jgi:hypothetical protein
VITEAVGAMHLAMVLCALCGRPVVRLLGEAQKHCAECTPLAARIERRRTANRRYQRAFRLRRRSMLTLG